jgi:hypothetical protein
MSYAETQFLLAETTVRGWGIDNMSAADRFMNGYMAAVGQFSLFDVPASEFPSDSAIRTYGETYLKPIVEMGGNVALEEINKQIWILHLMDPFEAWANIRRSGGMPTAYTKYYNRYPLENQSGGVRPNRLPYPVQEQSRNTASWQQAVDRLPDKNDDWTQRVWWDVQN